MFLRVILYLFVPLSYPRVEKYTTRYKHATMKVTLRTKDIADGKMRLYLDFYPPIINPETGKPTRREFLKLHLFKKPASPDEKLHNKDTRQLAKNIAAKRQLSLQAADYGFLKKDTGKADFLAFFKTLADNHKSRSKGDKNNWLSVHRHFSEFTGGQCAAAMVTSKLCEDFKTYLQTAKPFAETKTALANNSAVAYFNIFKRAVALAVKQGLLSENPAEKIASIRKKETQKEFLSLEELQKLAIVDCDLPHLKRAALFSALTGLRYSDIDKLVWAEVQGSETNGYCIRYTQKKTSAIETLPIPTDAYNLLGAPGLTEEKVFPGLLYSAWQNQKLQDWVYRAGIMRKITFHCFRHTYATLQLTLGTDIYTVSKMLGHRSVTTTQVYTKIVDQKKRDAAERIKLNS